MSLSLRTLKTLWGRAAARCSFADCRAELLHQDDSNAHPSLIGENCHIAAEHDGGPRADPEIPESERNKYPNLILLCRNHHKIIDDIDNGERDYPVKRLLEIKKEHESWVATALAEDLAGQKADEEYAAIVDHWAEHNHIESWTNWTGSLLSFGHPRLDIQVSENLEHEREWMLKRIWPNTRPTLESALTNHRHVLEVFHSEFLKKSVKRGNTLWTDKFYKIQEWNPDRYHKLLHDYEEHVALVQALAVELTRAGNLVIRRIREALAPTFRTEEGWLSVSVGPNESLSFHEWAPQYTEEKANSTMPFPGLAKFTIELAEED